MSQCQFYRMPRTIGRGASAHRCTRRARWYVTIRRSTGTVHGYEYCTFHANPAMNVQSCHPLPTEQEETER